MTKPIRASLERLGQGTQDKIRKEDSLEEGDHLSNEAKLGTVGTISSSLLARHDPHSPEAIQHQLALVQQ